MTSALSAQLAVGDRIPELKGEFLTGRKAVLPEAAAGKVTLLALGFTYESRYAVEDWIKRFRGEFGEEPAVGFFEVPMIDGMARMGKWFIDSGMRSGTPKSDHEHVVTVYGGVGPWKTLLNYGAPKSAYLILLDPNGGVAWQHSGAFDEPAYASLSAAAKKLLTASAKAE